MKRILSLFMALIIALSFTACENEDKRISSDVSLEFAMAQLRKAGIKADYKKTSDGCYKATATVIEDIDIEIWLDDKNHVVSVELVNHDTYGSPLLTREGVAYLYDVFVNYDADKYKGNLSLEKIRALEPVTQVMCLEELFSSYHEASYTGIDAFFGGCDIEGWSITVTSDSYSGDVTVKAWYFGPKDTKE